MSAQLPDPLAGRLDHLRVDDGEEGHDLIGQEPEGGGGPAACSRGLGEGRSRDDGSEDGEHRDPLHASPGAKAKHRLDYTKKTEGMG